MHPIVETPNISKSHLWLSVADDVPTYPTHSVHTENSALISGKLTPTIC